VQTFGNPHLLSDTRIALLCTSACFEASLVNVNVNLAMIRDDAFVSEMVVQVKDMVERFNASIGKESGSTLT
jgi:formiminotetrahydrofolate cyclodeaminase